MSDIDSGQRDGLLQERRAHAASNHADFSASGINLVSVSRRLVTCNFKAYEFAGRIGAAALKAALPI